MTIRTSIRAMAMAMAMAAGAGGSAVADVNRQPRATPTPAPAPAPAPAARQVRPTAWATAPATIAWPTTSRRRELVISRGRAADESYAWFIADGRTVVSVFLTTTQAQLDGAVAKFVRDVTLATKSSPTDSMSWGIAGVIIKPPPNPPDPGGFPLWYVEAVMKTATSMDEHVLVPQVSSPAVMQQPGAQRLNPGAVQQPVQPGPKPAKP